MLPGCQQVGQSLAMGLSGQLAQGSLGMLQRLALGPEGGVAQTGAPIFKRRPAAEAPTPIILSRTACTGTAVVAARFEFVVARTAGAARAVLAVAEFAATARRRRLGLLHAGPVVTPHGNHALGRGLGRLGGSSGLHVRVCGCSLHLGSAIRASLGGRRRGRHFSCFDSRF